MRGAKCYKQVHDGTMIESNAQIALIAKLAIIACVSDLLVLLFILSSEPSSKDGGSPC